MSHGLPNPPAEPPIDQSLDGLAPTFRTKVEALLARFTALGFDPMIAESFRSDARQAWLFGFGREYDDGRGVVTYAVQGERSWHRYGLAVDIVSASRGWDPSPSFWRSLGSCARIEGLAWGGDWPKFKDLPHIQFGEPMRQSPSSHAVELLAQGGIEAVWHSVGAA
jgi:hypothetical protein